MNARGLSLVAIALLLATGCTLRPNLISASADHANDETATVEVVVHSEDAEAIKNREIYFSIVVFDCASDEAPFPIQPHVEGELASVFNFPISSRVVSFQGPIPRRILESYSSPCVFLRGGSYVFGRIKSDSVPVKLRDDD